MVRIADEDQDNNRQWEAEQLAREQRSRRYEKKRDDRTTMKEEKDDKDEPVERFQYMMTTRAFEEEESPKRNDAAKDAKRGLAYLDRQELLILYNQDEQVAQVNAVTMTSTPQATSASWFASKPAGAITANTI